MGSLLNNFEFLPNENLWPMIENSDLKSIDAFSRTEKRIYEVSIDVMRTHAQRIIADAKDKKATIYNWINEFNCSDLSNPQTLFKFFSTISTKAYGLVDGVPIAKILNVEEVDSLSKKIDQIERESLQILWDHLCSAIESNNRGLPRLDRKLSCEQIRQWMNANEDLLNSVNFLLIGGRGLKLIPPEIGKLRSLTELCLKDNEIQIIPAEIGNLSSLNNLDLSNNRIQKLPNEIGDLSALSNLNLSNNQIQDLPAKIGKLPALNNLDLSNNLIQKLPTEIGDLQELNNLDLSNNQIQELPTKIGNLSMLNELNLSNNLIQEIPLEIEKLIHLNVIDLSHNQIKLVPVEFGKLTSLQYLNLYYNPIQQLPSEITALKDLQIVGLIGIDNP